MNAALLHFICVGERPLCEHLRLSVAKIFPAIVVVISPVQRTV